MPQENLLACKLIIFVIMSYLIFIIPSLSFKEKESVGANLYAYLAEGFLQHHLYLSIAPSQALLKLKNPYDATQNENLRLTDASLYKNKYYSYFGPLPAFTFFIPYKWLMGTFPAAPTAAFFFASLGFTMCFLLLFCVKRDYFQPFTNFHLLLGGLTIAFTGTIPYLLAWARFYEVAITSAFCAMSFSFFFLYQFFKNPLRLRNIFLFSLFLSLSIAGRPHFTLGIIIFPVILYYLWQNVTLPCLYKSVSLLLLPVILMGILLVSYNFLRFHHIVEFGQNFQLVGIAATHPALITSAHLLKHFGYNLFNYFLQPFFLKATIHAKNYYQSYTAGIIWTMPYLLIIFLLPFSTKKKKVPKPVRFLLYSIALFVFSIILFLCSLSGIAERYEMDFVPYLGLMAMVTFWILQKEKNNFLLTAIFSGAVLFSIFINIDFLKLITNSIMIVLIEVICFIWLFYQELCELKKI